MITFKNLWNVGNCFIYADLCEDPDAKQRIIELVDAVKHKQKLLQIMHEGTSGGDRTTNRRMSSARR